MGNVFSGQVTLTPDQLDDIAVKYIRGVAVEHLAAEYCVGNSTINNAMKRRSARNAIAHTLLPHHGHALQHEHNADEYMVAQGSGNMNAAIGHAPAARAASAVPSPVSSRTVMSSAAPRAPAVSASTARTPPVSASSPRTPTKPRSVPASTPPAPITEAEVQRLVAQAERRLVKLERTFASAKQRAPEEQVHERVHAAAMAQDPDTLEIHRRFGIAERQGVERQGTAMIFHTVDRPGARRADLLARRNTQIDWRPSPTPRKSADEEQFDRAFPHRTANASNTMVKREGATLTFDAAGAARAARERFARLHG